MGTIGDRISKSQHASGFDYMRIVLAVAVLCIHSFAASYSKSGEGFLFEFPLRSFVMLVLPMFFALSGFLICGSYFRCRSLVTFGALRVLRLVPALFVEVTLSALILGPLLSTASILDYASSPSLYAYFLNVVGNIHFTLPGVFAGNPYPSVVNVSLWTLPYELECYIALALLALTSILKGEIRAVLAVVAFHAVISVHDYLASAALPLDGAVTGRLLVMCFLYGMLLYRCRNRVVYSWKIAVLCFVAASFALYVPIGIYLSPLPIAYLTVYLGLLRVPRSALVSSGDYSYGIYLYAWPIQQTVSCLLPACRSWYMNVAISLPLTFAFAVLSWHLVEKRMMLLKSRVDGLSLKWLTPKGPFDGSRVARPALSSVPPRS